MSRKTVYFHLHTSTMNPCSMSNDAAEAAKRDWLCLGCNFPKPGRASIDVTLQSPEPRDAPLNFVYGFGIPIAKRAFLECFGDSVFRDLHVGRVFLEGGGKLSDWVTFRGKAPLIVRGTRNISYRVRVECGRNVYFAMGSRYLFPTPPNDHDLFESDLSGLIVSESMFDRIALNSWPKLIFDKLPVLDSPKDALRDLLVSYS
jgi:hypothetical protein